ncbi:MAG: glycosyltransferase family 4 protein, partial [Magnetococcales bacterium]|nr:glycosyltransferase family 4 protein [Magnetococcales bacterium]
MKKVKILTFTSLFPHVGNPTQGLFVMERLRHLNASGQVEIKVVAPLPWFPFTHKKLNPYAWRAKNSAKEESSHGLTIYHPRYFLIPKLGMYMSPLSMALASLPILKKTVAQGYDFDLIDAHYFYPDGIAATILGKLLNKPVIITARGSDLNQLPNYFIPKKLIKWAANSADGLITVCAALKKPLQDMGIDESTITVLRNGVDLEKFTPQDPTPLRKRLGITSTTLLSVGYLIDRKGHDLIIRAMEKLEACNLLIAGDGPNREELLLLIKELGLENRIKLLGEIPHTELIVYYGAVDALVLASSREGWANVLLEAMACGTPVVASKAWGTPEVVANADAGVLMEERSVQGVVDGVNKLLNNP